jgi:hypothetical protein
MQEPKVEEGEATRAPSVEAASGEPTEPHAPLTGFASAVKLPVPASALFKFNVLLTLFHGTLGIVTLCVGNINLNAPTYGSSVTLLSPKLSGSNRTAWVLIPSCDNRVNSLNVTVAVAMFFFLSMIFHLGAATLWRKKYESLLERGYAPFRWLEYAGSASLMYARGRRRSPDGWLMYC